VPPSAASSTLPSSPLPAFSSPGKYFVMRHRQCSLSQTPPPPQHKQTSTHTGTHKQWGCISFGLNAEHAE
jgi:hypothetical protein